MIKYKTIKNCGEIGIDFKDNDGTRVSKVFLEKLIRRIVKRSTNYYDKTGEHIFVYKEKQLHSVICPSIADLTNSYVIEHPLRRQPSGDYDDYSGNVDYWINYGNYTYLMELKHCYFGYKNADNPRKSISNIFNKALNQLKSIRKEECRNVTQNKGLLKIALQAIVFYESSNERISKDDLSKIDFKEVFQKLIKNSELKNKSNIISIWLLNERLIESVPWRKRFEIYPAVAFVGKVSNVIPPKQ